MQVSSDIKQNLGENLHCRQQCSRRPRVTTKNAPIFPSVNTRRNASHTSLMYASGEDKLYSKRSPADLKCVQRTSKLVNDPALVPGNLRKSEVPSATKILENFLSRTSTEYDGGIEGGKADSRVVKFKTRRKLLKSPKQRLEKRHGPEIIYPTMLSISLAKAVNLNSRSNKITKPGSDGSDIDDNEPECYSSSLRNGIKNDISMKLAPYSKKLCISKLQKSSQPNFSLEKYKYFKKPDNIIEHVNKKNNSHENDNAQLEKDCPTEKQPSNSSDCENGVTGSQPSAPIQDSMKSNKHLTLIQDAKVKQSTNQQTTKLEQISNMKEKRKHERTSHSEKLAAKEAKMELKRKQRQEIYALNKVMTDLENARFTLFMNNDESSK